MKTHHDVDTIARNLMFMGEMAAKMPKAYAAAGCRQPVLGPSGVIGHMLDGVGLVINTDLKSLGITKALPHVYERSPLARILDKLGDETGAITTYDGIIAARGAGNYSDAMANKASYVTVANTWSSSFRSGGIPVAGTYAAIPTGSALDRTNAGALSLLLANPASGTDYLLTFGLIAGQQLNCVMVADLLVAATNILATVNTAQTISSAALTRYTDGVGVYMTFDVTTAIGTTASNITVTYTNSAAVGSRSTGAQAMTVSAIAQRLLPIAFGPQTQLASGDLGVQSVQTVQLSAAMTAGILALNLYKPLCWLPGIIANIYGEKPMASTIDGLVALPQASSQIGCLTAYVYTNTTSTGLMTMAYRTAWG
jgi:hypothetical protein